MHRFPHTHLRVVCCTLLQGLSVGREEDGLPPVSDNAKVLSRGHGQLPLGWGKGERWLIHLRVDDAKPRE